MGFGSFLGSIAPLGLSAVGSAFGGPIGGMIGGAIGSGISGSIAAGQTAAAQSAANDFNFQTMVDENNFSAVQAQKQMDYQTQMSNTVYQRGAADMKAAGLNPMLAAGAPDPMAPGTMASNASMGSAQPVPSQAGMIASSSRDTLNLLQSLRESNARVLKTGADTNLASNYDPTLKESQGEVLEQQKRLLMKQNQILSSEADVISRHPDLFGYMKALSDRGVNASSAGALLAPWANIGMDAIGLP